MITRKFYSKYEGQDMDTPSHKLMGQIKKAKYDTPKQKYSWPETENQWLQDLKYYSLRAGA